MGKPRRSHGESLQIERSGKVAILTLNRPDRRNALDDELVRTLTAALQETEVDGEVNVVIVRGAGKDFCAGADLAQTARNAKALDSVGNLVDASRLGTLFITLRRLAIPVVAAVQGRALAGGAGLALGCDLVLASDNAELGYPEVHLGLVPAMVGAILRRQVGEKVAFELLARGERIGAAEALRLGLVNRVFPAASFESDAIAFATELASRPRSALTMIKRLLYGVDSLSFEDAMGRGAEINILARMTSEAQKRIDRFLEHRKP